jgi:ABC-type branched-subunit amino acid transport system substrate-binding protein
MRSGSTLRLVGAVVAATLATQAPGFAEKAYGPGVTDTEIKIGNTSPYSGPASALSAVSKTEAAYFKMINEQGGINGRKINFISYDDAFSPPKTVEQVRKLVESDEVLVVFQSIGTATNNAIQKYLNSKKVPQLFLASGGTRFGDPKNFPWTIGWQPNYQSEGRIYGKYILDHMPNGKIGVLWQNDDAGKDSFKGLRDGLGDKAGSMIVADRSYEVTDPTLDSQVVALRASGADIFFSWAAPKGTAQAIKKVAELGWKPTFFVPSIAASVSSVMKAGGLEASQGIISAGFLKDPTDPTWKDDAETKEWRSFMTKYMPDADQSDGNYVTGYAAAQTLVQTLKQCGDDLTVESVMKQAANLRDFVPKMILPGIRINTSPTDFRPIEQMQLMRFEGQGWKNFGDVITGEIGSGNE